MEAMAEIKNVISTFSHNLERAIQTEVRRQMLEQLDIALKATPSVPVTVVKLETVKRRGAPIGTKAKPTPCPTCGLMNTARRFRFFCADHRK